jgi:Skp family chaperone for outer membrane proteins
MITIQKIFFFSFLAVTIFSCSDKKSKDKSENKASNVPVVRTDGLKIAYYVQDSLMTGFLYYKEMDSVMKIKQTAFQAELSKKEKSLRDYITINDDKARSGQLSAFEIQNIQQEAQRREQSLYQYQQNEGGKLEQETLDLLEAIGKKIEAAAEKFSLENSIDILLIYGKGGQINYVNPSMNVTSDFINYLNEYQSEIEKNIGHKK